jgi:hypothetical protein
MVIDLITGDGATTRAQAHHVSPVRTTVGVAETRYQASRRAPRAITSTIKYRRSDRMV